MSDNGFPGLRRPDLPFFDFEESKNVTALLGKTAILNCRVKNIGNKTVSRKMDFVRLRGRDERMGMLGRDAGRKMKGWV